MVGKLFVIFGVVMLSGFVISYGIHNNNVELPDDYLTLNGVRVYENEEGCSRVGGLCIMTDDCEQRTTKQGLCKKNQQFGVECCYRVTKNRLKPESACTQMSATCMPECGETIRMKMGDTECATSGQVCCNLVN